MPAEPQFAKDNEGAADLEETLYFAASRVSRLKEDVGGLLIDIVECYDFIGESWQTVPSLLTVRPVPLSRLIVVWPSSSAASLRTRKKGPIFS